MNLKSIFLIALFCCASVFSYSYTAFSITTGEETFALNPFLYADCEGGVGSELFLSYGITDKLDIWTDISFFQADGFTATDFSTMLRYDIWKSNILAVRVSPWYVSPQYHFSWENELWGFQANIAAQVTYDTYRDPAVYGIFCPHIKLFQGNMLLFTEVNPGYYMKEGDFANLAIREEGFGMDIVPGIGFGIRETLFSIACPIYNVTTDATPTFGMWWYFPIKKK
jgi:hypothetical protein